MTLAEKLTDEAKRDLALAVAVNRFAFAAAGDRGARLWDLYAAEQARFPQAHWHPERCLPSDPLAAAKFAQRIMREGALAVYTEAGQFAAAGGTA